MKEYIIIDRCETITKYFKDVSKTNRLSIEDEVKLAIRIQNGDEKAIGELVKPNLKFVVSVAKEYQGLGLSLPDLISEGNIGIIKAASRFDASRGFKFISYAVYWIKQTIMQSLNDNSRMIRLPSNIINKIVKLNKTNGDVEEIYPTVISINSSSSNDSHQIIDSIADDSDDSFEELDYNIEKIKKIINKSLSSLSDREKGIIECYFGLNSYCEAMTLEAIGHKYNLTKERIRQIKEKAIRRLRHNNCELHSLLNNY